ncbi:MCE family protein [Nocardioides sp. LML1-1-1.1]|uniref:MCE family protein n=1 Tax=Nocardioides sp. LML1-1-1.1 TaxID=3135248 RepID=UPI003419D34F
MSAVDRGRVVAGTAYLAIVVALLVLCVLIFAKAMPWQRAAAVYVPTPNPGLELNVRSDVRFQGVRIGEVRAITTDGRRARIELAIEPGRMRLLASNVDAVIVPKTVFGEKFVDLRTPADPTRARLTSGDVVQQTTSASELGTIFDRLVPVLRAVSPDRLSVVLNALAQGLSGRGDDLGRALRQTDEALTRLDPRLDDLVDDLDALATTADVYSKAVPDLMRFLIASASLSSDLLVPQEQRLSDLLVQVGATSDDTAALVKQIGPTTVSLLARSRDTLSLLREYSSVLPCTVTGLKVLETLLTQAVGARGPYINLTVDIVTRREPYKAPRDLPTSPGSTANDAEVTLGGLVPNTNPHCPRFSREVLDLTPATPGSGSLQGTPLETGPAAAQQDAVDEARRALARLIAARELSVGQDDVPALTDLLLAPLLPGSGGVR